MSTTSPYPEERADAPSEPKPDWQDVTAREFDLIAKLAEQKGGALQENAGGAHFLYYGWTEREGRKAPILIAIKFPPGMEARKCRADMAAVATLG